MGSPNWYGHSLMYLGTLLRHEGEHDEAAENLAMGAQRLGDVGDVSCWAAASRRLASCEAILGDTRSAAERLVAVIDRMPALPMQEVAKPQTLDDATQVLIAAERFELAARTLGSALSPELPAEYSRMRDPLHQAMRERIVNELGADQAERLFAEGGKLPLDDVVLQLRGWLSAL